METDALHLPAATPGLVVVWVVIVFVLWFLYRYNPYFSRARFITLSSAATALLLSLLFFFWYRERPPADPFRLAIMPLVDTSHEAPRISPLSMVAAEAAARSLPNGGKDVLIYRPDWLREAAQLDSLTDSTYVSRFAKAVRADFVLWGSLQEVPENSGQLKLSWRGFSPEAPAKARKWEANVSIEALDELEADLRRLIPIRLASGNGVTAKPFAGAQVTQLRSFGKARLAQWRGDTKGMLSEAEVAAGADTSVVPAMLLWAEGLIDTGGVRRKLGREEEAMPFFRLAKQMLLKAVGLDSVNAETYHLLGRLYVWNERWDTAEEYLQRSQELDWWQPRLYLEVSRLHPSRYPELGARNEEELYRWAIFINPGCLPAYLHLADYYEFRNQWKRSIELLEAFLRINPNSLAGLMALGRHYVNHASLLEILTLYQRIVELDPTNAEAYYSVGVAYYNHEDLDTAEKFFEKAIRISDHADSHLYLAMIHSKRGHKQKAIDELRYRLQHRQGRNDPYAEEARKMLFRLLNTPETETTRSEP